MDVGARHCASMAADHETVRSAPTSEGAEAGGNDRSAALVAVVTECAWPSIDATWRFSLFLYGALVAHAPMYSAQLGGLQNSDVAPFA